MYRVVTSMIYISYLVVPVQISVCLCYNLKLSVAFYGNIRLGWT